MTLNWHSRADHPTFCLVEDHLGSRHISYLLLLSITRLGSFVLFLHLQGKTRGERLTTDLPGIETMNCSTNYKTANSAVNLDAHLLQLGLLELGLCVVLHS